MKIALILCLLAVLPFLSSAADEYDNTFCKDPVEIQKWQEVLQGNPASDAIVVIHALWVGLCVQVKTHSMTTVRANRIFETFRDGVLGEIQREK